MKSALIHFQNLTKEYPAELNVEVASFMQAVVPSLRKFLHKKNKTVLKSISSDWYEGEVIGIIGHNGAGKSTLLNIIAGTTLASSGELKVNGVVSAILTLGLGLKEEASGLENIFIDGELRGFRREQVDAYLDEVIEFSELSQEVLARPLRTYSTGMKSRLAFAMLVTLSPEILIIDEALGAGDAHFAAKASRKIKEICRRGKLVIIVSHSMSVIRDMCTRCLWLDQGVIRHDGAPEAVTQAYLEEVRLRDEKQLKASVEICEYIRFQQSGVEKSILEEGMDLEVIFKEDFAEIQQISFYGLDGIPIWNLAHLKTNSFIEYIPSGFRLSPFQLGIGYYYMELTTTDEKKYKQLFEVRTRESLIGGRPQFYLKAQIKKDSSNLKDCDSV